MIWRISINRHSHEPTIVWIKAGSEKEARCRFDQLIQHCRRHSNSSLNFDEGILKHTMNLEIMVTRVKHPELYDRFVYFTEGRLKLRYD